MKRIVAISMVLAIVLNTLSVRSAIGMPEVGIIISNCRSAQTILSQIEKADVGSRINRGHDYNEILGLMFAMNARLSSNKIAAPDLSTITADFEKEIEVFRGSYNAYDQDLSQLIDFKCVDNPQEFYSKLEKMRASRAQLKTSVVDLDQRIKSYYEAFDTVISGVKI